MGLIQAPPAEMTAVGAQVEALGPALSTLSCAAGGFGAVADPPATALALERLGRAWGTAAARLEDDVVALGRAVQASAVAYQVADDDSMQSADGFLRRGPS
jgi:hypothetical protein